MLFVLQISTAHSQYNLHNALAPRSARNVSPASGGHTVVELIDVKCDTKSGMLVTVEFDSVSKYLKILIKKLWNNFRIN